MGQESGGVVVHTQGAGLTGRFIVNRFIVNQKFGLAGQRHIILLVSHAFSLD